MYPMSTSPWISPVVSDTSRPYWNRSSILQGSLFFTTGTHIFLYRLYYLIFLYILIAIFGSLRNGSTVNNLSVNQINVFLQGRYPSGTKCAVTAGLRGLLLQGQFVLDFVKFSRYRKWESLKMFKITSVVSITPLSVTNQRQGHCQFWLNSFNNTSQPYGDSDLELYQEHRWSHDTAGSSIMWRMKLNLSSKISWICPFKLQQGPPVARKKPSKNSIQKVPWTIICLVNRPSPKQ
jgi:hypothetical protein